MDPQHNKKYWTEESRLVVPLETQKWELKETYKDLKGFNVFFVAFIKDFYENCALFWVNYHPLIKIGSGSWGSWMNWTDCGGCRDNNNTRTRTRSRKCFDSDMKTTLNSSECQGNEAEIESCAIECKSRKKGLFYKTIKNTRCGSKHKDSN